MFFESITILIALVIVSVGFLRNKKTNYVFSILPLAVIPFFNAIMLLALDFFNQNQPSVVNPVIMTVYAVGLVISFALMTAACGRFRLRRIKTLYLISAVAFDGVLVYVFTQANYIVN